MIYSILPIGWRNQTRALVAEPTSVAICAVGIERVSATCGVFVVAEADHSVPVKRGLATSQIILVAET